MKRDSGGGIVLRHKLLKPIETRWKYNLHVRYFAVISIDVPNYEGSLHDRVLQTYSNLPPITIREENRIKVS